MRELPEDAACRRRRSPLLLPLSAMREQHASLCKSALAIDASRYRSVAASYYVPFSMLDFVMPPPRASRLFRRCFFIARQMI